MPKRRRIVVVEFVEQVHDGLTPQTRNGLWNEGALTRWWLFPPGQRPPYIDNVRVIMLQDQEEIPD